MFPAGIRYRQRKGAVGTVGVLAADRDGVPGFASEAFHRELASVGARLGLNVMVFTPASLMEAGGSGAFGSSSRGSGCIRAYVPGEDGGWKTISAPLPDYVYDRHFSRSPAEQESYRQALRRLGAMRCTRLLGGGLPGKRTVQRTLAMDAELAPHLPPTAPLRSRSMLLVWLERHGELFLKPDCGSQGRGAFRVRFEQGSRSVSLCGRTPGNNSVTRRFADCSIFANWLLKAVGARPYLIQPYLPLSDRNGAAYDLRCLVQKDGSGQWQLTGIAVRRGQPGSVTANLHGGGSAEEAEPFLAGEFGTAAAARMMKALRRLSERVPSVLEARHGRLLELGIDYGIDRNGRVWLIEVNSKPGRAAFHHIGSPETRRAAVENPLRYARSLLLTPSSPPLAAVKELWP